jgi:hypothetical protein
MVLLGLNLNFLMSNKERKNILRIVDILNQVWHKHMIYNEWKKRGKSVPPPHIYKQEVVKEYGKKYAINILIETGTYNGDMVFAMKKAFKKIYSIELGKSLYLDACARFVDYPHVVLINGDSGCELKKLLTSIDSPCVFWLDAHYSEGNTAKGEIETPIIQELETIFSHSIKKHIILIDDARLFIGENDYPTIDILKHFILSKRTDLKMEVKDDIVRIFPM